MTWKVSKRAQAFKTGIFIELSNYKKQKINQGINMIDLSVGSPDLSPPDFIIKALAEKVQDPKAYGYTLKGIDEFNDAVQSYYQTKFKVELDAKQEILQVMGSQDGIVHLPYLFAGEGDIILVPDPGYTAYETSVSMAGAELYPMPLLEENDFLPDLSQIPDEIANRATVMILNFPGNPVPALATEAFFKSVIAFAKKYKILVLHDFAYCELFYDEGIPISFLSIEGAKEVGIEFNSLSKSFNMAGARIGYLVGNSEVIKRLTQFKTNIDYGVFEPIQQAAALALRHGEAFTEASRKIYKQRRDTLVLGLDDLGWKVTSPKASMFVWAKIPEGWTSLDFTYTLMDKAGIVVTPGHAFGKYGEGYVRIALVQPVEVLIEVTRRLKESGLFTKVLS